MQLRMCSPTWDAPILFMVIITAPNMDTDYWQELIVQFDCDAQPSLCSHSSAVNTATILQTSISISTYILLQKNENYSVYEPK